MKNKSTILKIDKIIKNIIGKDKHSKNNIEDEFYKLQREGKLPQGMTLQVYLAKKKQQEEENKKPAWEIEKVWNNRGW